jgi:dihydroorotase
MDVLLSDGFIADLGERLDAPLDTEVLDAAGLVVAPGFIDLHARFGEPGYEYKETIETGCRAAVAGGFTAVCCVPDTDPVNDDPAVTRFIRERGAEVGLARVYPMGAVSKGLSGEELAEIGEMVREGAVAFTDGRRPVRNAQLMRRVLEYAQSFDVPVAARAEDLDLSGKGAVHEGEISTRIGLHGIPAVAEEVMVARDTLLAEATGGRLHLFDLSSAGSFDLLRAARKRGVKVSCNVTPHHLALSVEDVARCNYDPKWKVYPPLRDASDIEAMTRAIADGTVDAIASSHSPHHQDEKELDFADAPFGIVGLETAVGLAIDRLVHTRSIGISQLVQLMSTGPAGVFSLPGGTLAEGSPADLTLLDIGRHWTVEASAFVSRSRNTPFSGMRLRGAPAVTIVAGRVVWSAK